VTKAILLRAKKSHTLRTYQNQQEVFLAITMMMRLKIGMERALKRQGIQYLKQSPSPLTDTAEQVKAGIVRNT
jgi:hypothetical protein